MTDPIKNELPDGTLRPMMTGKMVANANAQLGTCPIEDVIACPSDLEGTALYEIWYRVDGQLDMLLAYGRDAGPDVRGTLERIRRSSGGDLVTWMGAAGDHVGAGYTEDAVPSSWGKPALKVGMTPKQKRMFAVPTAKDLEGYRQVPGGDRS